MWSRQARDAAARAKAMKHSTSMSLSDDDREKLHEWREHLWNRGHVTRLARHSVAGGKLEHLHPGEIIVYRGRAPGSKSQSSVMGASYTKSRKVAEKIAGGGRVESLRLTKDTPALDVNKAINSPSKSDYEQEVFVVRGGKPKRKK